MTEWRYGVLDNMTEYLLVRLVRAQSWKMVERAKQKTRRWFSSLHFKFRFPNPNKQGTAYWQNQLFKAKNYQPGNLVSQSSSSKLETYRLEVINWTSSVPCCELASHGSLSLDDGRWEQRHAFLKITCLRYGKKEKLSSIQNLLKHAFGRQTGNTHTNNQ
jgi:hypothetical protein